MIYALCTARAYAGSGDHGSHVSGGGGAGFGASGCSVCHTGTGGFTPGGSLVHAGSQSLLGADGGTHDFAGGFGSEGIGTKGVMGGQGGQGANLGF